MFFEECVLCEKGINQVILLFRCFSWLWAQKWIQLVNWVLYVVLEIKPVSIACNISVLYNIFSILENKMYFSFCFALYLSVCFLWRVKLSSYVCFLMVLHSEIIPGWFEGHIGCRIKPEWAKYKANALPNVLSLWTLECKCLKVSVGLREWNAKENIF